MGGQSIERIAKAITGAGFLIAGVILIVASSGFGYALRLPGFIIACAFIVLGLVFSLTANTGNCD